MRKVKLLAALVLVLAVMVALKCCNGKEKETPEALTNDQEAVETIAKPDGEEVPLGVVAENESGGVSITVTGEDGAQETYVFEDVAPDSWYIDAVNYVVSTGLMKGSEDAPVFQPEYGIQRVQFAAVLYRLAGGEHEVAKNKFSDLEGDGTEWFMDYVAWITNHGYMNGKGDGTFDPYGFITCEVALIVLYRLAGEPKPEGTLEGYPYAPKVSSEGRDAVAWAWNSGLINEEECVWYPTQAISRAQGAALFMRYSAMMK